MVPNSKPGDISRRVVLRGGLAGFLSTLVPGCANDSDDNNCPIDDTASTAGNGGAITESDVSLHAVPVSLNSVRLTYQSRDENGFVWTGSDAQILNRYDPSTGQVASFPHSFDTTVSHCICMAQKVYMLGTNYPNLMIYDQISGLFDEIPYPIPDANVWYGTEEIFGPVDGRNMYLFNRNSGGIIKWDTVLDTGIVIENPFPTPLPYIGRYIPADNAIWCNVWDFSSTVSKPLGLLRLDPVNDVFTDWFPFPDDDAGLAPYSSPADTNFYQWTFEGKIRPFDFRQRRFCKFLDVPGYGSSFGWIGMTMVYQDRWYFTLSTYNGNPNYGVDCKPYHFLNSLLEFDPVTGKFSFATLETESGYYQISYILRAGNDFYANCNNIMRPDGELDVNNVGKVLFWQSQKPV